MNYFHFINNSETFESLPIAEAYLVSLPGTQLIDSRSIYSHLRECLEFPEYFGNNLDALYDCLTDLEWIKQNDIVLFIDQFDDFASKDQEVNFLAEFILCLYDACLSWSLSAGSEQSPKSISVFINWTKKAEDLLSKLEIPYDFN